MDIIVYTTPDKLKHKCGLLEDDVDHSPTGDYFWRLPKMPREIMAGDRIYFATQGFIRGYFIIKEINFIEGIIFNCSSWVDIITPIKIVHFQGFKYAKNVVGLTKNE